MLTALHSNSWLQEKFINKPYRVHGLLYVLFIVYGFVFATPAEISRGLFDIINGPDILVTDYIYVGGLGAALVSAGLSALLAVGALVLAKHEPNGLTFGMLGLVVGVALFGKNPVNMLPIIIGGYLYSRYSKIDWGKCSLPPLLGTCLAPAVTQLVFIYHIPSVMGVVLGIASGLFIGFIMTPLSAAMRKNYDGYNIYNVGFTSGMLGLCLFALYQLFGVEFETVRLWSSGYDLELIVLLLGTSVYLIFIGIASKSESVPFLSLLNLEAEGNDYFTKYREKSYLSMGILGFACVLFVLAMRAEFNGPVAGTILSVIGFGGFGKTLITAVPIVIGTMLAAFSSMLITGVPVNYRSFMVAALFSTCLCPLAKRFGFMWGIAAGFLHLTLSSNISMFHGGMNLYNNGFAGGLTAMMLLPIIIFFAKENA